MVILLIAFTPLKEFIPGYANVNIRKQGVENFLKSDSISSALAQNNLYIENIKHIIEGEVVHLDNETVVDSGLNYEGIVNEPIGEDSVLRNMIETEEKYNLFNSAGSTPGNISGFTFLQPLRGTVTNRFNMKDKHFGIDIVAPKNEAIKATLDGTVIFAEWTVETGYVIQLQHADNIVSIYKHNSVLHKEVGDYVRAGEVIAIIGNSGELSTGPHLHFELWYNGRPINPEEYMMF
jgi:murein DD-endopeptidase MepM/ murein hydrolase activator NlpD